MIVLVPLYRFSLEYEVASGQPYSELHSLILQAIAESEDIMLQMLQALFGLPSRVLIEILVMLFKEGWIAISAKTGGGFCITQQGRQALKFNKRPEMRLVEPKSIIIIMERLSGMLATQSEVDFEPKFKLIENGIWQNAYHVSAEYSSGSLDEGQAQGLLKYNKRQWLRHVSRPILTHDSYYLPVDIDRRASTSEEGLLSATGLPGRWRPHLEPLLIDLVRERVLGDEGLAGQRYWTGREPRKTSRPEGSDGSWPTQITPERDLLFTRSQHLDRLKQAFETAKSVILISSGEIDPRVIQTDLLKLMKAACQRQIQIDLLWERTIRSPGAPWSPAQFVANLERPTAAGLSLIPTNANANLLIHDTDEGFRALVGSFNWLATPFAGSSEDNERYLTIEIRHPGIIADLARSAAAFMLEGQQEQLLSSPDRWKRIAESQAREAMREEPETEDIRTVDVETCMVRVVRDQKHASLVSEYVASAQERVAIISERIDQSARPLLTSLFERRSSAAPAIPIVVRHKSYPLSDQGKLDDMAGKEISSDPNLNANAFVADKTTLISGYSFLARSLSADQSRTREVGIYVNGQTVANAVWDGLCRK